MKRLFLCKLWVKYLERLRDFVKVIVLSFPPDRIPLGSGSFQHLLSFMSFYLHARISFKVPIGAFAFIMQHCLLPNQLSNGFQYSSGLRLSSQPETVPQLRLFQLVKRKPIPGNEVRETTPLEGSSGGVQIFQQARVSHYRSQGRDVESKRNNQCSCLERHPLLLRHLEAFCTLWQFSYSPVGGDLLVHSRLALLKGRVAVQSTFALRVSNILPIEQQKRGAEKRRKRRGGRKGRDKEGKEKEKEQKEKEEAGRRERKKEMRRRRKRSSHHRFRLFLLSC